METAEDSRARRHRIAEALSAEIERQARSGASRIDVGALAEAADEALEPDPVAATGKRPSELNATNDD
ncbi:hypothetical protein O9Z70_00490 [Devosia sp. YIM 151766]|uniref:hypothetical protein n=1 Tax=Devosia sp. YIM 151766 TaxID=3017325 RepID=UPI00255C7459|nr:hypothetical protein [Devosia sp. YIM 151766]WIY53059.1 hypothetical protein O9Z70_00490 [Devosia sp. YIM 151766]